MYFILKNATFPDTIGTITVTEGSGGSGGSNVDPNATLTINPTPSDATVTLTATGYTQSGNSITVAKGTSVAYTVSKSGYQSKNGTVTVSYNRSLSVSLIAEGGSSGGDNGGDNGGDSGGSSTGDRVYTIGETLKFNDMPEVASTFISESYYKATDSGNPGSKLTIENRSGYKAWKNIRVYAGQSYALNPDARAICLYDADENAWAGFNLKNTYSDGIIPASVVTQDGWMSVTVTSSTSDSSCTIRRVS